MSKFKEGDKVKMTAETLEWNLGAKSIIGVIVKAQPNQQGSIRLRRDGLKTVETWHESAWEKATTEEQP